jgi:hypothetical protein
LNHDQKKENNMGRKSSFFFIIGVALLLFSQPLAAKDIIKNYSDWQKLEACKKLLDDPRPAVECYLEISGEEAVKSLAFDQEKGKQRWQEMVGLRSPDLVGKIAPEIKPGRYTLEDKAKYPFDKLMPGVLYERFNEPGGQGKNFAANFTEFEVVPTRQYWMNLAVAEASIANEGKAKLGEDGYMLYDTYEGGLPFPKPSGAQKGWQVLYNYIESYTYFQGEDYLSQTAAFGVDRGFNIDRKSKGDYYVMRLFHRLLRDPKGVWFDDRAEKQGEKQVVYYEAFEPRDLYGNAYTLSKRVDPNDMDNLLLYTPLTRRIRKMSSSDRQDQAIGLDYAYDDVNHLDQKLTPRAYPYKVRVLEEREFLVPMYSMTGDEYFDSKSNFLWRNLEFERRPMYVLEMEQLDSTYIYSKRIYYVDKETFIILGGRYYDQKDRLWRAYNVLYGVSPEIGIFWWMAASYFDHIDVHSGLEQNFTTLSLESDRGEFGAKRLLRGRK